MTANKVFVAGHRGMVGSAICRQLENDPSTELIVADRQELDLLNQSDVSNFLSQTKPDFIYLCAAKVGGIHANNNYPADFIYENLTIQNNVIHSALICGTKKLLLLGSSCIYPKFAKQPMKEEQLLTGFLEPTNEPYAIAKIAGIKLCESYNRQYGDSHGVDFRSIMPTNLYGPGDNYHSMNSHVIPGLIRRFHEAKVEGKDQVYVWGSGEQKREFLFVDDLAIACIHVMGLSKERYQSITSEMCSHLNAGYGQEVSIKEMSAYIAAAVGYDGNILFDTDKPDGSPRKMLDSSKLMSSGWSPTVSLKDGLKTAYSDFLERYETI